jgi:hypothetical protein
MTKKRMIRNYDLSINADAGGDAAEARASASFERRVKAEEWYRTMTEQNAKTWIEATARAMEDGARNLREQAKRFDEICKKPTTLATPVNVLSWAVNDVQNVVRNLRLDLACSHSAALALTQRREP